MQLMATDRMNAMRTNAIREFILDAIRRSELVKWNNNGTCLSCGNAERVVRTLHPLLFRPRSWRRLSERIHTSAQWGETATCPPKSFDEVEYDCNVNAPTEIGGMLASIHSAEENEFIRTLATAAGYCHQMTNIGLRCTGRDCKWDDGSPITFISFNGEGPPDDGQTRCYGVRTMYDPLTWSPKDCGTYPADCWLCSIKAKSRTHIPQSLSLIDADLLVKSEGILIFDMRNHPMN
ncbi:hypothetical protein PMAYCL1PPCAC_21938 [Pristionchus mayeri]|uniref:C-type lectin domain-containing protein n=1 Tax=Pristionchus mayeri TaxID=1317129 RepID=A0AAN5CVT7_9BILA|nr:hypothetical protein PMAYCL1PPCAC_21938 [Pristionchus mayeri]